MKRKTIVCRKDSEWIVKAVEEIVETKKILGIKTSFSYELLRLAKNALTKELDGIKLDREIFGRKK